MKAQFMFKPVALFAALLFVSACDVAPSGAPDVDLSGIPPMACTVAEFTSDTGDADFVRNNRAKTFVITPTATGFQADMRSDVFNNSSVQFVVTSETMGQINTIRSGDRADSSLYLTMSVAKQAENGRRTVVQQNNSVTASLGTTINRWVLDCRDQG